MASGPCGIERLQCHAEGRAGRLGLAAGAAAIPAFACIVAVAALALGSWPAAADVTWAIARLSALLVLAAFLILVARVLWNYSNVWLGRAGTLEDLGLALRLIGIDPATPNDLSDADAKRLLLIVRSLEKLRRKFEDELLKTPAIEILRWVK